MGDAGRLDGPDLLELHLAIGERSAERIKQPAKPVWRVCGRRGFYFDNAARVSFVTEPRYRDQSPGSTAAGRGQSTLTFWILKNASASSQW